MTEKEALAPASTEAWASFKVSFIHGTNWDTVQMVLQRLQGVTLRLTYGERTKTSSRIAITKDVTLTSAGVYPGDDVTFTFPVDHSGNEQAGIAVTPVDDEAQPIGPAFLVAYEDIIDIGVY